MVKPRFLLLALLLLLFSATLNAQENPDYAAVTWQTLLVPAIPSFESEHFFISSLQFSADLVAFGGILYGALGDDDDRLLVRAAPFTLAANRLISLPVNYLVVRRFHSDPRVRIQSHTFGKTVGCAVILLSLTQFGLLLTF